MTTPMSFVTTAPPGSRSGMHTTQPTPGKKSNKGESCVPSWRPADVYALSAVKQERGTKGRKNCHKGKIVRGRWLR